MFDASQLRLDPHTLVEALYDKERDEELDDVLDVLFTSVDHLCLQGRFDIIDEALVAVDVDRLGVVLLVGVLASTLPARGRLVQRSALVERVRERLNVLDPDRIEGLMMGLD